MGKSILRDKSYAFPIKIVKLSYRLRRERNEYIITKQLIRSGTAIGALFREAEYGQSTSDFIHKLSIALKEANETDYWICILPDTGFIETLEFKNLQSDLTELKAMLISSINTSKNKLKI